MGDYRRPGIYIQEVTKLTAPVKQAETAIPAFIGYTETGPAAPTKIASLDDYRAVFGGTAIDLPAFTIGPSGDISTDADRAAAPVYTMFYMLQMYFANGGGPCYIVSAGHYTPDKQLWKSDLLTALASLENESEPTIIVFTDAHNLTDKNEYHQLLVNALEQAALLKDRFLICDVLPAGSSAGNPVGTAATAFRDKIGFKNLMFGAAYYPYLQTNLTLFVEEDKIAVSHHDAASISVLRHANSTIKADPTGSKMEESLYHVAGGVYRYQYHIIKKRMAKEKLVLPPGSAVAGAYCQTDKTRGVWKSPANLALKNVESPVILIGDAEQAELNVSSSGKSINAIRNFPGRGTLIWGARTLDGNSSEWRYIAVRRFCNMVEESIKKAIEQFIGEPNDAATWGKVKTMVENFLMNQWRAGALVGTKPEEAFFVKAGMGETMTLTDISRERMVVEIGVSVLRPAEFILMRFSHKMKADEI